MIVFAQLQLSDHDRRQLILREGGMFAIALRPQHTLRAAGFVFQTEEGKLVAFLRGADLEVADNPATRHANPGRELGQFGRFDRLHSLQGVEIAFERVTRNVKAERRFFRS